MSFKVIAALYGTLATTTAVGVAVAYNHGAAGHGRGDGAQAAAVAAHSGAYVDDRKFGLVLPYYPALHGPQGGGENGGGSVVTWYRTREEVALAAEHAAQVTGDPQIIRTAQIQRALADNNAKSALVAEAPAVQPSPAEPQRAVPQPTPQPAAQPAPQPGHAALDERRYALILPYNARIHGASGGGRDHEKEIISWYRSREEMARAAEDAARLSGDPQILRIAREKRSLADREAGDRRAVADNRPAVAEAAHHQ